MELQEKSKGVGMETWGTPVVMGEGEVQLRMEID